MKKSLKFKLIFASLLSAIALLPGLTQDTVLIAEEMPQNAGETRSGTQDIDNLPSQGVNDRSNPPAAPPKKGGSTTRGGEYSCELRFNNSTPWHIDLYANNQFLGTIAPYGDAVIPATAGDFRLFGRAEFTDGSVLTWGPQGTSMAPGEFYKWTLTP